MAVEGVAGEAACTHDQPALVRHRQADLHAELVGLAGLPLADAFNFGRVQGVQLVLVVRTLAADAFGTFQPGPELVLRRLHERRHLALHLAQQHAQDRALAAHHLAQSLELLGMGIAAGAPPQALALALVRHLELQACSLGQAGNLGPRHFQQPAVRRVGDGLLLHRGVDCHALQLDGLDRLHRDRRLDGRLEQLLHPGFTQHASEAPDLSGVAGQLALVVLHAAEELPDHVLAPALDHGFITLVERVLEVQQRDHQPDRQARPARTADAARGHHQRRAKHVGVLAGLAHAGLAGEQRGERRFNLRPGHAPAENRERVAGIHHAIQPCAKEVVGRHRLPSRTPRNQCPLNLILGVPPIGIHPASPVFMRVPGVLQGRLRSVDP